MDAVGGMAQDTRQLTNSVCLRLETCFPTLILSNFMNPRQSSLSDLDLVSKFDFFSSALAPHTHARAHLVVLLLFWWVPRVQGARRACEWAPRPKGAENKFILQIEQISEKIIRLKQIDSIHFYVILKDASTLFFDAACYFFWLENDLSHCTWCR